MGEGQACVALTGLGSFWQPTQTCRSGLTHFAPRALDHVVLITMEGAIFGDVAVLRLYVGILERLRAFVPLTPAERLKMGHPAAEEARFSKKNYATTICFCNSGANRFLGIMACTPRTMSTTWVTRKLHAMLSSA